MRTVERSGRRAVAALDPAQADDLQLGEDEHDRRLRTDKHLSRQCRRETRSKDDIEACRDPDEVEPDDNRDKRGRVGAEYPGEQRDERLGVVPPQDRPVGVARGPQAGGLVGNGAEVSRIEEFLQENLKFLKIRTFTLSKRNFHWRGSSC